MFIRSLLDTDLYKFTMMQAVLHRFPAAKVRYAFRCRTPGIDLRPVAERVRAEIHHLCSLSLDPAELDYLRSLRYLTEDFIQFLRLFRFNEAFVNLDTAGGEFRLSIEGPWLHTILYEVPLLAIVSEAWSRHRWPQADFTRGAAKLARKIELARKAERRGLVFQFCDFGTRRRFSHRWQSQVVAALKAELPACFVGTSNVRLAMDLNLNPIGTMAHEWLMAAQALGPRLADSQRFALDHWVHEYRGDLGIALSDVVGFEAFLRDFDLYFAKLFDGCRHDSGDPFDWGERLIRHYLAMGIDPRTKTAIFSDGLEMDAALELARHFEGRIRTSFGIGTSLTHDLGLEPIQIVIKMVACQGSPVAKISDSPGKQMCEDPDFLTYLGQVFGQKEAS